MDMPGQRTIRVVKYPPHDADASFRLRLGIDRCRRWPCSRFPRTSWLCAGSKQVRRPMVGGQIAYLQRPFLHFLLQHTMPIAE